MGKRRDREIAEGIPYEEATQEATVEIQVDPPVEVPTPEIEPSDLMSLRVFATIAGPKWDQMRGFLHWAQMQKLDSLTMADWQNEYQKFQDRPVK